MMTKGNGGTTSHHAIAAAHTRALSQRRHLRHLLLNITTVECMIWRGWRVGLTKQENVTTPYPHFLYFFEVLGDEQWKSTNWRVLFNPTRASGRRMRERREAVITETINHLLTLPERAPELCPRCGVVITRPGSRVNFCTEKCQKQRGNAEVRERKRLKEMG